MTPNFKQTCVAIAGREAALEMPAGADVRGVIEAPPLLADVRWDDAAYIIHARAVEPGRGALVLDTAAGPRALPIAVFAERECFLITALCCNMHEGWDPSLHDRLPHPECCGPDKRGNAFEFATRLAAIIHGAGLPVTWFIDPPTAESERAYFEEGRRAHGDEIGFMPSSFSHFNSVNFNLERTLEETTALVREGVDSLANIFNIDITTVAVDQFIGSVGTNFALAAAAAGACALWGVGFDHRTCDTSMFHFGCPWNPYRPRRSQFRTPGRDVLPLWMFQWTFRDLINSVRVPGWGSGAVMFSTDTDDILACGLAPAQPDYYHRLAEGLLANRAHNDVLVMTIHQEDHDAWKAEGNAFYERFYQSLPPGFTPATMGEVAAWLDLKFPSVGPGPLQALRLEDPITHRDAVSFCFEGLPEPHDWPKGGASYPPHVFIYDDERQLVFEEGRAVPLRWLDYRRDPTVLEDGAYPEEPLPVLDIREIETVERDGQTIVCYKIVAADSVAEVPLAVWSDLAPPPGAVAFPGGFVIFLDLAAGENQGEFPVS